MVLSLLGRPDETRTNPFSHLEEMLLFKVERVLAVERTPIFIEASKQYKIRRCRAKIAAETQIQAAVAIGSTLEFQVPKLSVPELKLAALIHVKNSHNVSSFNKMQRAELLGVLADYLFSQTFPYTVCNEQIKGKIGRYLAMQEVDRRVREALADAYPYLAAELTHHEKKSLKGTNAVERELAKPMGRIEQIAYEKTKIKWTDEIRETIKKAAIARWAAAKRASQLKRIAHDKS